MKNQNNLDDCTHVAPKGQFKSHSQQKKKDVGTLSNPLSGDTKRGGFDAQDDTKLQLERSASLPVDNHSADKIKVYHPKSINEAIDLLQEFLECDLYSKFRPEKKIGKEKWYRLDWIKSEKEFKEYIDAHFNILRKDIKRITRNKQFMRAKLKEKIRWQK